MHKVNTEFTLTHPVFKTRPMSPFMFVQRHERVSAERVDMSTDKLPDMSRKHRV